MPHSLDGLTQKQLKGRKVVANHYKSLLENEVVKINKYIGRIDNDLNTNPTLKKKPYSNWTRAELMDAKRIYEQAMMRVREIEMTYKTELKEIDQSIINL